MRPQCIPNPQYTERRWHSIFPISDWGSDIALIRHAAEEHQKALYVCQVCDEVKKTDIKSHMRLHQDKQILHCEQCKKTFTSKQQLQWHQFTIHKDYSIPHHVCKYCNKRILTKPRLVDHVNSMHTKEKIYKCPLCGYTTFRKSLINDHKNNVHKTFKRACPHCGEKISGKKSKYRDHVKKCDDNPNNY